MLSLSLSFFEQMASMCCCVCSRRAGRSNPRVLLKPFWQDWKWMDSFWPHAHPDRTNEQMRSIRYSLINNLQSNTYGELFYLMLFFSMSLMIWWTFAFISSHHPSDALLYWMPILTGCSASITVIVWFEYHNTRYCYYYEQAYDEDL